MRSLLDDKRPALEIGARIDYSPAMDDDHSMAIIYSSHFIGVDESLISNPTWLVCKAGVRASVREVTYIVSGRTLCPSRGADNAAAVERVVKRPRGKTAKSAGGRNVSCQQSWKSRHASYELLNFYVACRVFHLMFAIPGVDFQRVVQ
jgi:hypothetical protein